MTSGALSRSEPVGEGNSTKRPPIEASGLLSEPERYYLRLAPGAPAREVTLEEYLSVERACDFIPSLWGQPACAHFEARREAVPERVRGERLDAGAL